MILRDFIDDRRGRQIPLAEYPPAQQQARGLIFFSVGFGGTRQGYSFLAREWSSLGFRVVVVEHVGSNLKVLKELNRGSRRHQDLARKVKEKVSEPQELLDRPLDLLFLRQHYPGENLGLAGHSFGAYTVMAALGCPILIPGGGRVRLKQTLRHDLKGLVVMSPQPPGHLLDPAPLAELAAPALVLTGTQDSGMPAGVDYRERLKLSPYLGGGGQSGLLEGADHMSFAGVGLKVGPITKALRQVTGRFWQQALKGEAPSSESLWTGTEGFRIYWNEEALCQASCSTTPGSSR